MLGLCSIHAVVAGLVIMVLTIACILFGLGILVGASFCKAFKLHRLLPAAFFDVHLLRGLGILVGAWPCAASDCTAPRCTFRMLLAPRACPTVLLCKVNQTVLLEPHPAYLPCWPAPSLQ